MFKAKFWLESSGYKLMHITGFQLNFLLKFKRVQSFIHEILKKKHSSYMQTLLIYSLFPELYTKIEGWETEGHC